MRWGRIAVSVAIGIAVLSVVGCRTFLFDPKAVDRHDVRLSRQRFEYAYEIHGVRALGDDALTMLVSLHYDEMPVLHVDRVEFRALDRRLFVADPYFGWVLYDAKRHDDSDPFDREQRRQVEAAGPLWQSIESSVGDDLRALFAFYEAPGYSSLSDFDRLPELHATELVVKLVRWEWM